MIAARGVELMAFPEAQSAIVASCGALASEPVALGAARGRVAAETLVATEDLVPFARSAMDGYAVASADLRDVPIALPVRGGAFAGSGTGTPHLRGTATPIATGAALPPGADAVVPIEDTVREGDRVRFAESVAPGDAVFPPGEDARRGDVLVEAGTALGPAAMGILAAAGTTTVRVHRRPVATVLCSGDELVDLAVVPGPGQIRNSNAPVIAAALADLGADVRAVISLADDRAAMRAALDAALNASDLVVTTGGASVGERDFVKPVCDELGVAFAFRTVALRPAKPSAFGRRGDAAIAVLPGNPAAAFVAFHELVHPAVRALAGYRDVLPPSVVASLDGEIRSKPGRHFAAFAALIAGPRGFVARPLRNQCSSLTRTVAEAAGFIIVPPGEAAYRDGDPLRFDVVDWAKLRTADSR